jgi:hypothetical protein
MYLSNKCTYQLFSIACKSNETVLSDLCKYFEKKIYLPILETSYSKYGSMMIITSANKIFGKLDLVCM